MVAPNFNTLTNSSSAYQRDFFHSSLATFKRARSPPLRHTPVFLVTLLLCGLMSITVALVAASILSLRRASGD